MIMVHDLYGTLLSLFTDHLCHLHDHIDDKDDLVHCCLCLQIIFVIYMIMVHCCLCLQIIFVIYMVHCCLCLQIIFVIYMIMVHCCLCLQIIFVIYMS